MVYSQTKKTASIASITNQKQGGGNKKAGLPHTIGRESNTSVAMRGTAQYLFRLRQPNGVDSPYNVNQSRPIGVRPGTTTYF
jgi:hypothetical protein